MGDQHIKKTKKKQYKRPTGYKLGDVFPKELKDRAYAYRRRANRDKLKESNKLKGDQLNDKSNREQSTN